MILGRLLRALRAGERLSLRQVLDLARQDKYTGEITLHVANGQVRQIGAGRPFQSAIVEEEDASGWATAPAGLDKHP